jgi:hypothetical protein
MRSSDGYRDMFYGAGGSGVAPDSKGGCHAKMARRFRGLYFCFQC